MLGNSLKTAKINRIIAQANMAIAIFHSFGLLTLSSKTLCSKIALTRAPRGTMTRFALLSDGISPFQRAKNRGWNKTQKH